MDIYVTYLTTYSGNKMPPFYIGSSSLIKVNNGYHGSVKSKRYSSIWKSELKQNPQLFKTVIISKHNTRQEASNKEYNLQVKLKVVISPLYINMSVASPNGFFGMNVTGENNPNHGKKPDNFDRSNYKKPKSEEFKRYMKGNKRASGKPKSEDHKSKLSEANKGKIKPKRSEEEKLVMSIQRKGRKWYNDGIKSYHIKPEMKLEHYTEGRLKI